MDPNTALKRLREICIDLNTVDEPTTADLALEMRDAFEGLDEWLKQGGFLPKDWTPSTY